MKRIIMFVLTLGAGALAGTVNFDEMKTGAAPPGWSATKTGTGDPQWTVARDETAPSQPNVLRQSGRATFPICIKEGARLKDGFVEVKFKPLAGKQDQAGGLIWRCQDADNYYIARANALEDNVTIYHTVKAKRVAFQNANTKVAAGVWHTLRVDFRGSLFTVTFDRQKVIEARDDSFAGAGRVGVWTKADSVTLFDDFSFGGK
ncbi:MAG: hypothetical protein ABSF95_06900 [Verrucomicrobiota bacterium]